MLSHQESPEGTGEATGAGGLASHHAVVELAVLQNQGDLFQKWFGLVYDGFMGNNMLKSTNAHVHHTISMIDSLDCRLDSVKTLALVVGR